jgi:hypothetical protein
MSSKRLLQIFACGAAVLGLSACGMFGSKPAESSASVSAQEFDPYARTWKASGRTITPPPSEPSAALAAREAAAKEENSAFNKAGRAMKTTASAVTGVVKKPLEWLPFGKKDEASAEGATPAPTAKTAAQ